MPEQRMVERYFERILEAVESLTRQIGRAAWALEAGVRGVTISKKMPPCAVCGSQVQVADTTMCPGCLTHYKDGLDA